MPLWCSNKVFGVLYSCRAICFLALTLLACPCFCFFQENPLDNLNLAFDVAEKHLNIPRMLDAEGRLHCSLFIFSWSGSRIDEGSEWRLCGSVLLFILHLSGDWYTLFSETVPALHWLCLSLTRTHEQYCALSHRQCLWLEFRKRSSFTFLFAAKSFSLTSAAMVCGSAFL